MSTRKEDVMERLHADLVYSDIGQGGRSHKEYHLQLVPSGAGWIVTTQYGRIGGTLNREAKTKSPVSYEEARRIYERTLKEKLAKGYVDEGRRQEPSSPVSAPTGALRVRCELLTPIAAGEAGRYVLDATYWLQKKEDGRRRLLLRQNEDICGLNRGGQAVPLPPGILQTLRGLALTQYLVDGEEIGEREVVWDLLELEGEDLRPLEYGRRFELLVEHFSDLDGISIVPTWKTTAEKERAIRELWDAKVEGAVFKKIDAPFRPGRSGQHVKLKFQKTCSAKVTAVAIDGKANMAVALLADGKWLEVAKVSTLGHTPPRVGQVVEVRYLYATAGRRLYQPCFLGVRDDIAAEACTIEQLRFKAEEEELAE